MNRYAVVGLIIVILTFSLGCLEKAPEKPPEKVSINPENVTPLDKNTARAIANLSEIRSIEYILYSLGYRNISVGQEINQTSALTINYPLVNWRVIGELPALGIKANFFLPGNSTAELKNAIVQIEQEKIRDFADNCERQGYKNVSIQMTPLDRANNGAQLRQWSGSARLPLDGQYATIYLSDQGTRASSQVIVCGSEAQYLSEKPALIGYLATINRNDTSITIALQGTESYDFSDSTGTHSFGDMPLGSYDYIRNQYYYHSLNWARMSLSISSSGVITKSQLERIEKALSQKGYLFTFLQKS